MSSTHDKVEGTFHEAKGKVIEKTGAVLGNKDMEARGKAENVDGQIEHKVGDVKAVFGK